jgi:cytochrome c-type biogenesis protein CcmH/NrfG
VSVRAAQRQEPVALGGLPWENARHFRRTSRREVTLNRYTLIGLAVGLVLGVLIGYQAGSSTDVPHVGGGGAGIAQMPPTQAGDNYQARITTLQQIVARDPKNAKAWTQLGNDYFDTRQPQKAIEAYDRALELHPDDPDVLTDQGTMYRETGQFDKAVANFRKANQAAPNHVQSLFNLGIVYSSNLNQAEKAVSAWKKVIEIAPKSPQADQARIALEELKRHK